MFGRILVKEWRENILIFSAAVMLMLALVGLNISGQESLTLQFSGMFLLLFLPFAALLVGSGGFYSEHKDNAWIYILSRPIRKELVWIFKYLSQLSILLVILILFFAAKRFLPGLDRILEDISLPDDYIGLVSFSLYVVIPLTVFTMSFSISLLYEKQFVVFFAAIIIGGGLGFVFQKYTEFLWMNFFHLENLSLFWLFVSLSFVGASILTFLKTDFSQPRKKLLSFSKYLVGFLSLSFLLGTLLFTEGRVFSRGHDLSDYSVQTMGKDVYFHSYRRGLLRFDSAKDKMVRLGPKSWIGDFSARGGKIAFLEETRKKRAWHRNLWLMNSDGTGQRALVDSPSEDSPFHNLPILSIILSSDAEKVAFLTPGRSGRTAKEPPFVWWMNTDGSQPASRPLISLPNTVCKLIAWPAGEDYLILLVEDRPPPPKLEKRLVKFHLADGSTQVSAENVVSEYQIKVSPGHDFVAFTRFDPAKKQKRLSILDLKKFELLGIPGIEAPKLWSLKWSEQAGKVAYSANREIGVFDAQENKVRKISERNYEYEPGFDWISGGNGLVMIHPLEGENYLRVLGREFNEEKTIRIPVRLEGWTFVWGLEDEVLLKSAKGGPLWRVDLKTEDWQRVY